MRDCQIFTAITLWFSLKRCKHERVKHCEISMCIRLHDEASLQTCLMLAAQNHILKTSCLHYAMFKQFVLYTQRDWTRWGRSPQKCIMFSALRYFCNALLLLFPVSCFKKKLILLIIKEVTAINKCCSFELSIHQRFLKIYFHHSFHTPEAQLFSTLIIIINVSWSSDPHIRVICEGSCDTKDWNSLMMINSALITIK